MAPSPPYTWRRDAYRITTETTPEILPQLNDIFDSPDFHWGKSLSESQLRTMLKASTTFALFHEPDSSRESTQAPRLTGLGRWITDNVTVVYVNDIFIMPEHRGNGLAKWMLSCMNELLETMPDLRGTILIVEKGTPTERLYKKHFGMQDLVATDVLLDRKGPGSAYH